MSDVRAGAAAPADLRRRSRVSWWQGQVVESLAASESCYQQLLAGGDATEAAEEALRLALGWAARGDLQVCTAWVGRAKRLLEGRPAGPVTGYLRYLEAALTLDVEGDAKAAEDAAVELEELATRFAEPALSCFALVLRGLAATRRGDTVTGFAALDEAMLPVLAGQVDAAWAGDIYCTVIHLCQTLGDLTRMRAWTEALERWAAPLSRTFSYAAVTRVHQLQLQAAEGHWDLVEDELGRRSEGLVGAHGWVAGEGYAQLGDVRRLRGDLDGAREAYERAAALGVDPQPGAALLLRATGTATEALPALRAALGTLGPLARARLLPTAVELALDSGDRGTAGLLTAELQRTAAFFGTPGLRAMAQETTALLLAEEGQWRQAVAPLEAAARIYREQRHRHAIARVHERLALVRRALGEADVARAEEATALAIYRQLQATPDVERLSGGRRPGGLTDREAEVLSRVASGASNRDVATALGISDKTVSRHLANIFTKLGVATRTAAAAWAREHGVVVRRAP